MCGVCAKFGINIHDQFGVSADSENTVKRSGNVTSALPFVLETDDTDGIFNNKEIFTLPEVIPQLDSGARLFAPNGIVTYTFLTTPHAIGYYNNPNWSIKDAIGYSQFTAEQMAAAREAIELWDDLIPLSFVESNGAGADIVFANTSTGPAQAHAFYPGVGVRVISDVWTATPEPDVNPSNGWLNYNGYGWDTLVHELGHAVGLSHPGAYNFNANFTTTFVSGAEYAQDTRQYSIMSYWDPWDTSTTGLPSNANVNTSRPVDPGVGLLTYPQTPMLHDIYVIQTMYGADVTTRAGASVYGFNTTEAGTVYDFTANRGPFLTIYDAGGIDELDMSGAEAGVFIDLRSGSFSSATPRPTLETANEAVEAFNADDPFSGQLVLAAWTEASFGNSMANLGQTNGRLITTATGVSGVEALSYMNIALAYNISGGPDTTIENATGSSMRDYLSGNGVANVLKGLGGNDVLSGLGGNDTLDGGEGLDVVAYLGATQGVNVTLHGDGQYTTIEGTDTFISIEGLFGSDFNDTLTGDDGDNIIGGGKGNDALHGGGGNDILSFMGTTTALNLTLDESGSGSLTNAQTGAGDDTFDGFEGLAGGSANDVLTGNSQNNVLDGDDGNDTLNGMAGDDRLLGGWGNDTLNGGVGNDTLNGGTGTNTLNGDDGDDILIAGLHNSNADPTGDTLNGGNGNDSLIGSFGNDVLNGGAGDDDIDGDYGADTISGGEGNDDIDGGADVDRVTFAGAAAAITVNLAEHQASGQGTDTIFNVENVTGSDHNDSITGDDNANALDGGAGNDTIVGGAGNDSLTGGAGDDSLDGGEGVDTVSFASSVAGITLTLSDGDGTATGEGTDTLVDIENVTGGTGNDALTGDGVANVLNGGAGDDTLNGGGGNDTLNGGAGTDTLNGGEGDDTLAGGLGDDTLNGGAGNNDTASYAASATAVTVNLTAGTATGEGADTLTGIENVIGSGGADTLIGDGGANVLSGGAGNDTLDGRGGNDTFDGGAGTDIVTYIAALAGVNVTLGSPNPIVTELGSDTFISIEGLTGSNFADTLTGDANANTLNGADGNDTLNGMGGNDTLSGGAGNDTLNGGDGTDTVTYAGLANGITVNLVNGNANAGAAGGSDTLVAVENVTGTGFVDDIKGNALANTILAGGGNDIVDGGDGNDGIDGGAGDDNLTGGLGNDTLLGGDGVDTISGGAGNDGIQGGAGNDNLDGGLGIDTLSYSTAAAGVTVNLATNSVSGGDGDTIAGFENVIGSGFADTLVGTSVANSLSGGGGNDSLTGGAGDDSLDGGAGDDMLAGGAGADTLVGGAGLDTFVFADVEKTDKIGDFTISQGDKIDLSAIDANSTVDGNQAFTFIGDGAFTAAGQLRYDHGVLSADINGDGTADLIITVSNFAALTGTDFFL